MDSHILMIMRHAKSDWSSDAAADFERPLSKRGCRNASQMGAWLEEQNVVPDRIVCSPATRTKMTAQIVCNQLGKKAPGITWDDRIYEAGIEDLLDVISEHGRYANCLLLIGHNPGLDALLNFLSKEKPQPDDNGKLMTTAAIAVLNYDSSPIRTGHRSARLAKLIRPKELSE
ncbi:MAG: phosphohistidine phosphatase SixA [Gammaproteobacteria bacterium]|nr:phosphohistidine phosphatase SixA [Gammaproteobacteria bacterium]